MCAAVMVTSTVPGTAVVYAGEIKTEAVLMPEYHDHGWMREAAERNIMSNIRKHKLFDRPVVGIIVSILIALVGIEVLGYLSGMIFNFIPGTSQIASSLGVILLSFLWLFVHLFWFRGETQDFMNPKKLASSILLGWSMILMPLATFILNIIGGNQIGNVFTALILALSPGLSEEVIFRIIPVSIAMRSETREKIIPVTIVLTSVIFGFIHSVNILAGANPFLTVLQILYATAIGLICVGIYMRTGNIWVTIVLHTFADFMDFLSVDLQGTEGAVTAAPDLGSVIYLLFCAFVFFINAFTVLKKDKRNGIPETWDHIWKKK